MDAERSYRRALDMLLSPASTDIRVVVGDTHGDHARLLELLRACGALDHHYQRSPGFWLCHLGDVIHAGHGVQKADAQTLSVALEYLDCLLIGNHETPFAVGIGGFAGMNEQIECQAQLDESFRAGRWTPAAAVDGWLLTHGGLHPRILREQSPTFAKLRDDGSLSDPDTVALAIRNAWQRRITTDVADPLFDAVSIVRGGSDSSGGILWCDWSELIDASARESDPLRQIVGHTPLRDVELAADGRAWCVDVGAALSGYLAALIKKPAETRWRALRVGDGRRAWPD